MHLTRGHTALRKSVDRIKIGSENVRDIHERTFLHRVFSMTIDGILKNCSCFIDYRLLMLYRILLNLCIQQEDILHYLAALTESKMVQKCRNYSRLTLFYRHFCMKIDRIFKHCSCFIDYRLLKLYGILLKFCVWQETILHNMTTLSDSKSVQKCRNYSRLTLSLSAFFYEKWWNF